MKNPKLVHYVLSGLVMTLPAAVPFEGRRYWLLPILLGLSYLAAVTVRFGAFRPKVAFLLLSTFVFCGWFSYLIFQIRVHVLKIYGSEWREDPFVGVVFSWFLVFVVSVLYFPPVFVRGLIKDRIERHFSWFGLLLWSIHSMIVVWYTWMLANAI